MITQQQFIKKWKASTLEERSAAQAHFIDLCRLPGANFTNTVHPPLQPAAPVAEVYGWTGFTHGMPDEEILRRLSALNLART